MMSKNEILEKLNNAEDHILEYVGFVFSNLKVELDTVLDESNKFVDREPYRITINWSTVNWYESIITGDQIRTISQANVLIPHFHDIFLVTPTGIEDQMVMDDDNILVCDGIRFYSVPSKISIAAMKTLACDLHHQGEGHDQTN